MIEASLVPLFKITQTGKIMDVNNASVNITGLSWVKLIDADFFDYLTDLEKARAGYEEIFAKVFDSDYTFNIILMDLQMSEMNDFENKSYIRNEMKSQIPIIALMADATTGDLSKCRAVSIHDYIVKPLD